MTAEDYLRYKEQENKRFFGSESLNIGEAYKAVKMARKEEREKLKALFFEKVQAYCKEEKCDMPPVEIARIYTDIEIELSKAK